MPRYRVSKKVKQQVSHYTPSQTRVKQLISLVLSLTYNYCCSVFSSVTVSKTITLESEKIILYNASNKPIDSNLKCPWGGRLLPKAETLIIKGFIYPTTTARVLKQ